MKTLRCISNQKNKQIVGFVIALLLICIGTFAWLIRFSAKNSQQTALHISELYLRELTAQIVGNFRTSIDGCFAQMYTLADSVTQEDTQSQENLRRFLRRSQQINHFAFLSMLDTQGQYYSSQGILPDASAAGFPGDLMKGKNRLLSYDETAPGNNLILLGIKLDPIRLGDTKLVGMLAGIDAQALNTALSLKKDNAKTFSSIVTPDGSYIINNSHSSYLPLEDNLFTNLEKYATFKKGYNLKKMKENFSAGLGGLVRYQLEETEYYLYYDSLAETGWYMLTIIPCSLVDASVNGLIRTLTVGAILVLLMIICMLAAVFGLYLTGIRRQAKELQTARTKAEEARARAEAANRAKSDFLSRMSHEIRTPMNGIIGMSEIALRNVNDPVRVQDSLQKVKLSSRHLLSLINDVLDMSKIESGRVQLAQEAFDFRAFIESASSIYYVQARSRQMQYETILDGAMEETLIGDSLRLNQILSNLLSNALKFTPPGGKITLKVTQCLLEAGQTALKLAVSDTGCGIKPENFEKIFQAFEQENAQVTGKYGGTGLGLSIVRSFAHLMDGDVTVSSVPGKGSTFLVDIVLGRPEGQVATEQFPDFTALLLDGGRDDCAHLPLLLEQLSVQPVRAETPEQAVRLAEQKQFDFCLIDGQGAGPDGLSIVPALCEKNIPVFLLAYDLTEQEQQARAAGVTGTLQKPLFRSTLEHALQHLGGQPSRMPGRDGTAYDFQGKHILLAEDNELNREIALDLLEETGAEITTAVDGVCAVELFRQSEEGYFHLILMDVQMPRMDGYEAARTIRAMERADAKTVPIFAVTANAFAEDAAKSRETGMNAHVSKPLDIQLLYEKMNLILSRPGRPAE